MVREKQVSKKMKLGGRLKSSREIKVLILRCEIGYQVKRLWVTDNQVMVVPGADWTEQQ